MPITVLPGTGGTGFEPLQQLGQNILQHLMQKEQMGMQQAQLDMEQKTHKLQVQQAEFQQERQLAQDTADASQLSGLIAGLSPEQQAQFANVGDLDITQQAAMFRGLTSSLEAQSNRALMEAQREGIIAGTEQTLQETSQASELFETRRRLVELEVEAKEGGPTDRERWNADMEIARRNAAAAEANARSQRFAVMGQLTPVLGNMGAARFTKVLPTFSSEVGDFETLEDMVSDRMGRVGILYGASSDLISKLNEAAIAANFDPQLMMNEIFAQDLYEADRASLYAIVQGVFNESPLTLPVKSPTFWQTLRNALRSSDPTGYTFEDIATNTSPGSFGTFSTGRP